MGKFVCQIGVEEGILLDNIDKDIFKAIQEDFPLSERPYDDLAERLCLSREELLQRVMGLKDAGVIRRIGAVLNSGTLGIVTTLCAAKVPKDKINTFAEVVNSKRRVTHNYLRDGRYNVWFTLWGKNNKEIIDTLAEIKEKTGVDEISLFPSLKTYKIKAVFNP